MMFKRTEAGHDYRIAVLVELYGLTPDQAEQFKLGNTVEMPESARPLVDCGAAVIVPAEEKEVADVNSAR